MLIAVIMYIVNTCYVYIIIKIYIYKILLVAGAYWVNSTYLPNYVCTCTYVLPALHTYICSNWLRYCAWIILMHRIPCHQKVACKSSTGHLRNVRQQKCDCHIDVWQNGLVTKKWVNHSTAGVLWSHRILEWNLYRSTPVLVFEGAGATLRFGF